MTQPTPSLRLVKTCSWAPEQYDVLNVEGRVVGYLRVRSGYFSADAVDGDLWWSDPEAMDPVLVYEHEWPDEPYKGGFDNADEAEVNLAAAVAALEKHYAEVSR